MSLDHIRPPRWVLVLALLSAAATFIWTMATAGPDPVSRTGFPFAVRSLFVDSEWSRAVDLARDELEGIGADRGFDWFHAAFFLALALERRGFEGDSEDAESAWQTLRREARAVVDLDPRTGEADPRGPGARLLGERGRDFVRYVAGYAWARAGETAAAERLWRAAADSTVDRAGTDAGRDDAAFLAGLLALLGERDRAMTAWYRAVANENADIRWAAVDPDFDRIRSDPLFDAITETASSGVARSVRARYVAASGEDDFGPLIELLSLHTRYRPEDTDALLFLAFAVEAEGGDACELWTRLFEISTARADNAARASWDRWVARTVIDPGSTDDAAAAPRPERLPAPEIDLFAHPEQAFDASTRVPSNTIFMLAWSLRGLGDPRSADMFAALAAEVRPGTSGDWNGWYNFACYSALAGHHETAMRALARSAVLGGSSNGGHTAWARVDPDLAPLHHDPRFEAAVTANASPPAEPGAEPLASLSAADDA